MTNPITPPPELIEQWMQDHSTKYDLARHAAQWGADTELEACCAELPGLDDYLRAARRPKPPSLNSIALQMLGTIERDAHYIPEITDTIRRALEALDD
jgi:hypothetical protein